MTKPIVVGTGLLALDVVFRGRSTTPIRQCAGGTCGNVLAILSYLGWKAIAVARHADDHARKLVENDLSHWGVDLRFVGLAPQAPTPIIVERILAGDRGDPVHRFSLTCPCCGSWLPRYRPVVVSAIAPVISAEPSPSVFFFDRPSPGAIALAARYSELGALIVFEPSANAEPTHFGAAIQLADIVKYSDQRFGALPRSQPTKRRLEIQTLGGDGLRYRFDSPQRMGAWHQLSALPAGNVIDTAGAGDWCTAGLLSQLGKRARIGFASAKQSDVKGALRYGQALSAWTCRFEGARGGMYERSDAEFRRDITAILNGSSKAPLIELVNVASAKPKKLCPACHDAVEVEGSSLTRMRKSPRRAGNTQQ